jgi:hypothetical protein
VPLQKMLDEGTVSTKRVQAILGQDSTLKPAVFDLSRMGPHFVVAGPPLSGKSTTLYNWVLSLAEHYPPERVVMILIDVQRRFNDYDGQHRLDELPHVLTAISELEELEALMDNLRNECEAMATQDLDRELFIIIDNYDDLSEEIERNRDLARDLATLARRYGRDGLHIIIAGTLDSSLNDLRRRVQGSNFGIGLVTAQAVETLRVSRTPTAVRNRALNVGRGFTVKSGQPSMIQVATPYDGMGITITSANGDEPEDDEEKVAQALDIWVERIVAKYPDQKAAWSGQVAGEGDGRTQAATPQQSEKLTRMMTLLRKGMQKELQSLEADNGADDLVTAKLVQMEMNNWYDENALLELLKELWFKEKTASGMPEEVVQSLASVMDEESLLMEVEAVFETEEEE